MHDDELMQPTEGVVHMDVFDPLVSASSTRILLLLASWVAGSCTRAVYKNCVPPDSPVCRVCAVDADGPSCTTVVESWNMSARGGSAVLVFHVALRVRWSCAEPQRVLDPSRDHEVDSLAAAAFSPYPCT